jgi:hypothetical protein
MQLLITAGRLNFQTANHRKMGKFRGKTEQTTLIHHNWFLNIKFLKK